MRQAHTHTIERCIGVICCITSDPVVQLQREGSRMSTAPVLIRYSRASIQRILVTPMFIDRYSLFFHSAV